jgi:hypothetical protein
MTRVHDHFCRILHRGIERADREHSEHFPLFERGVDKRSH